MVVFETMGVCVCVIVIVLEAHFDHAYIIAHVDRFNDRERERGRKQKHKAKKSERTLIAEIVESY